VAVRFLFGALGVFAIGQHQLGEPILTRRDASRSIFFQQLLHNQSQSNYVYSRAGDTRGSIESVRLGQFRSNSAICSRKFTPRSTIGHRRPVDFLVPLSLLNLARLTAIQKNILIRYIQDLQLHTTFKLPLNSIYSLTIN